MCPNKPLKNHDKMGVFQLLNQHEQMGEQMDPFLGQVSKWLDGVRECPTMQL
jgi:hypothetical protein